MVHLAILSEHLKYVGQYLFLGCCHALVTCVFRFSRCLLPPDGVSDAGVGEGQNGDRKEVLPDHDQNRIDAAQSTARPVLFTHTSPVPAQVSSLVNARDNGHRKRKYDGDDPDGGYDPGQLTTGESGSQRESYGAVAVDADGYEGEGAEEDGDCLTVGDERTEDGPERPVEDENVGYEGEGNAEDSHHDVSAGHV